jgi:hypothetical protein
MEKQPSIVQFLRLDIFVVRATRPHDSPRHVTERTDWSTHACWPMQRAAFGAQRRAVGDSPAVTPPVHVSPAATVAGHRSDQDMPRPERWCPCGQRCGGRTIQEPRCCGLVHLRRAHGCWVMPVDWHVSVGISTQLAQPPGLMSVVMGILGDNLSCRRT